MIYRCETALIRVLCPLRINYDVLGNTDSFLHAHIFPRYDWEDEVCRKKPVWLYPAEEWRLEEHQFNQSKHIKIKTLIQSVLQELMQDAYRDVK